MLTIIKTFFSSLFGNKLSLYFILGIASLFLIIFIFNGDSILSRFGFETTSSLKQKIAQLEESNKNLLNKNAELAQELKNTEKYHKKEVAAIKTYYENKVDILNKTIIAKNKLINDNKSILNKLEEENKELANKCNLDEGKFYLYKKETYDSVSVNNYKTLNELFSLDNHVNNTELKDKNLELTKDLKQPPPKESEKWLNIFN